MSLAIGTPTVVTTEDFYTSPGQTALTLTPSATLAKRVRGRIQVTGLNSAGGILAWRVSVNSTVLGQFEQVVVAGDTAVCWETPVVTVPANGVFAVTCQSSNSSDTSVSSSGQCWSAEEQDELTADHAAAGSTGAVVADAASKAGAVDTLTKAGGDGDLAAAAAVAPDYKPAVDANGTVTVKLADEAMGGTSLVLTLGQLVINSDAAGGAINIDNSAGAGIDVSGSDYGAVIAGADYGLYATGSVFGLGAYSATGRGAYFDGVGNDIWCGKANSDLAVVAAAAAASAADAASKAGDAKTALDGMVSGDTVLAADTLANAPAGTSGELLATIIDTLASQTSFTLAAGSADNDAYNGCQIVVTDASTVNQKCVGWISDYIGASKTVTLASNPGVFTMAVGDAVSILPAAPFPATALANAPTGSTVNVTAPAPTVIGAKTPQPLQVYRYMAFSLAIPCSVSQTGKEHIFVVVKMIDKKTVVWQLDNGHCAVSGDGLTVTVADTDAHTGENGTWYWILVNTTDDLRVEEGPFIIVDGPNIPVPA